MSDITVKYLDGSEEHFCKCTNEGDSDTFIRFKSNDTSHLIYTRAVKEVIGIRL